MGDLSDIVDLTISIESAGITRSGFGTVLIGGYHNRTTGDRVSTYNKLADMADDDFETTDLEYIAAARVKGQEVSPKSFKVARLGSVAEGPTMIMDLYPTTAISTTYGFELAITGSGTYQDIEYTSSATANSAEILNGLTAAIAAAVGYSGNLLATTASGKVRVSGASAGKHFALRGLTSTFSNVIDETADPGVAADLNTILEEDSDWYALVLTYKSQNIATAAAGAINALRKMYIVATMDKEVLSGSVTDDIGSTLHGLGYTRTIVIYNDDHMAQPDAALAGVWLPYTPGSETLKFKPLAGILATNLSASNLTQLRAKKVNFYTTYAGVGIVAEGVVAEGKFADLIRFVDALYADIQESVFALLVQEPKVPFTPAGISQVEGVIRAALQRGVAAGGLLPDFDVEVPALADVSAANKEARNLSPVTFSATSAGAIHGVTITGSVAV
jgi:hypothetical protein